MSNDEAQDELSQSKRGTYSLKCIILDEPIVLLTCAMDVPLTAAADDEYYVFAKC